MAGFDDPAFYGDRWAEVYDEHHAGMDPAPAVEFLAGLAGYRRVLELAIGTGRVALPLAGRGIAVEGVDASEAMVARLRAKPGGVAIPVVIGDFNGQGTRLRPIALRYSWPSELDLMAQQAGLRLRERHSGWDRQPFGSDSRGHVSVYQRD